MIHFGETFRIEQEDGGVKTLGVDSNYEGAQRYDFRGVELTVHELVCEEVAVGIQTAFSKEVRSGDASEALVFFEIKGNASGMFGLVFLRRGFKRFSPDDLVDDKERYCSQNNQDEEHNPDGKEPFFVDGHEDAENDQQKGNDTQVNENAVMGKFIDGIRLDFLVVIFHFI